MALDAAGVSQGVAGWLTDALQAAPGVAVDGVANLLKDDLPIPGGGGYLIPAIGQEIGRRACRRYADNATAFDPVSAAGFERLCRPYLDDIGYGGNPSIELPFRGGQCSAVYTINYTLDPNNAQATTGFLQARGPIAGIRREQAPTGSWITTLGCHGIVISGSPNCRSISEEGFAWRNVGGANAPSIGPAPRINSITPCGTDNCGNPPPVVVGPSAPAVPDPPGPRPFSPAPNIDIDIDVNVPIVVGVGPVIVFDIGVGPIEVDPFPGDDSGGDDGGSGDPSDGPPGDVGEPAPPSDTGDDGTASGCAPEGSVLVGVKVTVLEAPPFGSEYDPLVRRGVCYAYFGVPGNLALEPSGVALRSGQFLFAPKNNLTCYEVRANTGYNLRVTPYYRALERDES